jgi:SAM-dependent methyltransferase
MTDDRSWARKAGRLAAETAGEPTRWVEELWSSAERDEVDLPWDRTEPFPDVARFVADLGPGAGRPAVVVGAALGADAEALARAGWDTVAFDISPAVVRLVRQRYPESDVDYRNSNLLDLADDLVGAFDLVVEVFTVQSMPPSVRPQAVAGVRRLLAPGGTAVVVQFVRGDADPDAGPPWLLDRAEMESFAADDGVLADLEVRPSPRGDRPRDRIWVATLRRSSPSRP